MGTGTSGAEEHYLDAATSTVGGSAAKTTRINGLPVLGFAAFEYTNATSNYGFVADHKTSVGGSGLEK